MSPAPVRVMLVDDSPVALAVLRRMLEGSPEVEGVGTARDGREGVERIAGLRPDVLCTDFVMPGMDGLELTREVMAHHPCPILVISSVVGAAHPERVFALLQAGAVDVFPKPQGAVGPDSAEARQLV